METGVSKKESPIDFEDIKFKEVNILRDLLKTKSVRELARQRGTTPGHISKVIQSLENKLGFQLLDRSNLGVQPSPKALELTPLLDEFKLIEERLQTPISTQRKQDFLGFASTSFFSTHLIPQLFNKMQNDFPNTHCRIIDLQPSHFIPAALRSGFQVCIHLKNLDWPKTWTSTKIGELHWTLCCRKSHPLLKKPTANNVLKHPFVYPTYWTNEGIQYGDDHCPIPIKKRIRGHETSTAIVASEIIRNTNQIGFLPELVIRPFLKNGELVPIEIPSWKTVKQKVFLTVKSDYVKQKTFTWLEQVLQTELNNRKI